MKDDVLNLSASDFKAKCLTVFRDLERRKIRRVIVARRGKPIAELTAPRGKVPELWGCLRGSVSTPRGVDLTEPLLPEEEFDAARGVLQR